MHAYVYMYSVAVIAITVMFIIEFQIQNTYTHCQHYVHEIHVGNAFLHMSHDLIVLDRNMCSKFRMCNYYNYINIINIHHDVYY